jgi:hypothetical protein
MAKATASASVVVERWKELYEQHPWWLRVAILLAAASTVISNVLPRGWLAWLVSASFLLLRVLATQLGYRKKPFRVTEHSSYRHRHSASKM